MFALHHLVFLGFFSFINCLEIGSAAKYEELFPKDCGRIPLQTKRRSGRIVSGNNADFGEYPWQVLIKVFGGVNCGGALINSNWVVTAAHCTRDYSRFSYTLHFGELDRVLDNEPLPSVTRKIAKIIPHPNYIAVQNSGVDNGYDIVLLKLSEPVQFKPHIQPICLPGLLEGEDIEGKIAKVSGWGKIYRTDDFSSILQEVSLPILNNNYCKGIYLERGTGREKFDDTVICAGYTNGKFNVCNGDSGGPLTLMRKDGRRFIIGVVAWIGLPCADANTFTMFTKISHYVPWMRRVMMQYYTPT